MNHTTIKLAHHWHEDLADAVVDARTRRLPILSLRLLGRLDHELSCANSRFFKKTLYPDAAVARVLERDFVLHWQSVRPVPIVTIDYGDGRSLVRTLTGNSAHLVLDEEGRPVDALPGLYRPALFLSSLAWSARVARAMTGYAGEKRKDALARWHAARLRAPVAPIIPTPPPSPAREAGSLAMTKMMIEKPMLDRIDGLTSTMQADEAFNERVLHRRIHARFAGGCDDTAASFTAWMYDEVFLMPENDPWLGLV